MEDAYIDTARHGAWSIAASSHWQTFCSSGVCLLARHITAGAAKGAQARKHARALHSTRSAGTATSRKACMQSGVLVAADCHPAPAAAETAEGGTSSSEHRRYSSPMPAPPDLLLKPASAMAPCCVWCKGPKQAKRHHAKHAAAQLEAYCLHVEQGYAPLLRSATHVTSLEAPAGKQSWRPFLVRMSALSSIDRSPQSLGICPKCSISKAKHPVSSSHAICGWSNLVSTVPKHPSHAHL